MSNENSSTERVTPRESAIVSRFSTGRLGAVSPTASVAEPTIAPTSNAPASDSTPNPAAASAE